MSESCPACGADALTSGTFPNGAEGRYCEACNYSEIEGLVVHEGDVQ